MSTKIFSSWRWRSTDPKDHFIPQKYDLLLSFLVPEKPFPAPLIDMSAWAPSTCLRQEVFLSASYPGRDPWSQPRIFPRWHLYWRMHPVVGQMFLAEVQGQNKWALFSRAQDTKRATHWKPFLIVNTTLVVPVQGEDVSEYLGKRNQQLWQRLWNKLELLQEILGIRVSAAQIPFSLEINIIHIPSSKQPHLLIWSPYLNYKCSCIMKPHYTYDPKYFCILLLNHNHMSWSSLLNLIYSKSSSALAN